jgi:hypothetical protein
MSCVYIRTTPTPILYTVKPFDGRLGRGSNVEGEPLARSAPAGKSYRGKPPANRCDRRASGDPP